MRKSFKKYFIPSEENDHKPHFLRERSVLVILAIASILLFASVIGTYVVKNSKFLAAIQSAFLVDLANEDRAEQGAGKLVMNEELVLAAQFKANDMAQKSYFAHTSPEGLTPWHWFGQAGYDYIYAGENLAVNFNRSEDVQRAWMNSPLHRANILNNRYKEIGIATAEGMYKGEKTTFVVQMFGTPTTSNLNTAPAPQTASVNDIPEVEEEPEDLVASIDLNPEVEGESIIKPEVKKEVPLQSAPNPSVKTQTKIAQVEKPVTAETKTEVSTEVTGPDNIFTETTNPLYEGQNVAGTEDSRIETTYTNWFERFLVNPGDTVNKAYVILFVIILFSLILKIFIAINKQHPKNIAYGVLLLILVLIFMYINQEMFIQPVVASV
jgi:uncharacterized protein YkwD